MALGDKVIVTCAVTGALRRRSSARRLLYTAADSARSAGARMRRGRLSCIACGAAMMGKPSYDAGVFEA